jgi:ectoine hydroxylase-related dioxygenase (phytanoyl-CoA dioxygenase family)
LIEPQKLFHVHDQLHFRIDRKGEDRFQLQWHQDYWYNNTSTRAVTVWIPLFDTTLDMGPVQFIDGSHRVVTKVKIDPHYKTHWDQNKLITLAEEIPYEAGNNRACHAGSAVFLNALTMHRSGRNTSDRNRFSIVLRYADLFDPELVGKRWKARIMPGHVSLIHQRPDLIANMDELKATGAL